jgi:hypothetical protein
VVCPSRGFPGGSLLISPSLDRPIASLAAARVRERIIHKNRDFVNKKLTFSDQWLMLALGGFDPCDIDREMMGKLRAIAAKEPIKCDAVFVAKSVSRVDG